MTKLWERLDTLGAVALLDPDGAINWLLKFPARHRLRVSQITASVLDSTYEGDDAVRVFSERFDAALAMDPDPYLREEVMAHLAPDAPPKGKPN